MKAIETEYNGHRFRSRLEARWAVFFDVAGINYIYEPEGFERNGDRYLPDFYLPEFDAYCEVKPNNLKDKTVRDSLIRATSFIEWGGPIKELIILSDIPEKIKDPGIWHFPTAVWEGHSPVVKWGFFRDYGLDENKVKWGISGASYQPPLLWLYDDPEMKLLWVKINYEKYGIKARSDYEMRKNGGGYFDDEFENEHFEYIYDMQQELNKRTFDALDKARKARFEHGEKG